jgi:hypothetical protein
MSLSIILTALVVVTAFIYSGATTPFLNNEAAFAAACDASPTATPIVAATSTPGSCDMGMNIMAQAGSLSAIAPANVTMSDGTGAGAGHITGGTGTSGDPYTYTLNGASQTFNLAFTTLLSDYRGGTTGWNLQANTGSLPGGSSATITSASATCTSTCYPAANSLSTPSFPLSLSSSPAEFIGAIAATSGNFNTGDYTLATTGTLTLPNIPAGTTVNGTLTLTLNDADYV